MKLSLAILNQMKDRLNKTWPEELREDLKETEPEIYEEAETIARLIAEHTGCTRLSERNTMEENTPQQHDVEPQEREVEQQECAQALPPKQTLVTNTENHTPKGQINWADFTNLLFLYTLGKLVIEETPENLATKRQDTEELTDAVEGFLLSKGKKMQTAEQRLETGKSKYLDFGKRVVYSLSSRSEAEQASVSLAIMQAENVSYHHAAKLKKIRKIASHVFRTLNNRYNVRN